jgi:hypothetical protein
LGEHGSRKGVPVLVHHALTIAVQRAPSLLAAIDESGYLSLSADRRMAMVISPHQGHAMSCF